MSENSTEQTEPQLGETQPDPEAARAESVAQLPLHDAPEDVPEDDSKGYAVFNRTLGQFLPGVEKSKPRQSDATKRVPEGHTAAVVRV